MMPFAYIDSGGNTIVHYCIENGMRIHRKRASWDHKAKSRSLSCQENCESCNQIIKLKKKESHLKTQVGFFHGDPYGNRTHVTAVKGRCLNRLTNGPGSGNLIRTDDIPGMNRLLYQLSYAAMWVKLGFGTTETQLRYNTSKCGKSQALFSDFFKIFWASFS